MIQFRGSWWAAAPALLLAGSLVAQESPGFRITDQTFNAGGHPSEATRPASAGYRASLGSIGEPVAVGELGSPSYRLSAGFVSAYPPPGEVAELRFTSPVNLTWTPQGSTGVYNVYRALVSGLPADSGSCWQDGLLVPEASDGDPLPSGATFFYLATAVNRLGEEGTKGRASDGSERANPAPCP